MQVDLLLTSTHGFTFSGPADTWTRLPISHGCFCGFSRSSPHNPYDMSDAFKSSVCHPTPARCHSKALCWLCLLGRGQTVPGWLSTPAWTTSGLQGAPTTAPANLAVGGALPPPRHQNISAESGPAHHAPSWRRHRRCSPGGLSPACSEGQQPHLPLPPQKGGDADSQQRLQKNPLTNPVLVFFIPSGWGGFPGAVNVVCRHFLWKSWSCSFSLMLAALIFRC